MKKVLLLAVLVGFVLSGCSYYTCPTYAKAGENVEKEEQETIAKP